MATVTYKTKTNSNWNSIYIRFKQGNKFDYLYSTGIRVPKGRWSKSKQEVLPTKEINSKSINLKLKELKIFILKEFEDAKTDVTIISTKWFKEKTATYLNQETNTDTIDNKIFITNYITSFIKESETRKTKNGGLVLKRTIQHYNTTNNKIKSLERKHNKRYKLIDIDLDFHSNFLEHLIEDQHLSNSTVGGYIDDLRLFCRTANKMGYAVSNEYKLSGFYSPTYKTKDIYLNLNEIKKIHNTKIENKKLDNAKDWLVIGLCTGLRVSDLLNLSNDDIKDNYINITTQKTNSSVIIPIHQHIKDILNKRGGGFPRKISDQKFNDYIKEACRIADLSELVEGAKMCPVEIESEGKKKIVYRKKVGMYPKYELVSSHICRRSFATNLYEEIDTSVIMKITGHKSESQFLKYIKITPKQSAVKLKDYWDSHKDLFI